MQIGLGSPETNFQSYRPINDTSPSIFVFGSIIMGKEPLAELKFAIFKNWLDTRPKMETHEPRVYPTILGGVSRGFWSPFEDLGAQSAIFWHLKTGTFALLECQKMALPAVAVPFAVAVAVAIVVSIVVVAVDIAGH